MTRSPTVSALSGMRRKSFLATLLALPGVRLLGSAAPASAAPRVADAAPPPAGVDEEMVLMLLRYVDHAGSWDDVVDGLRRYVADERPDAELVSEVADIVEQELARSDAEVLVGASGFYPGTVLMLHGLVAIARYGDGYDVRDQSRFVGRLMVRA